MVKISILLLLLFPLLSACSLLDSRENLYLSSSHARQLKEGMEVQLNGISVGTLENIALQEDLSVLSKLRFKEELHLSVDTDFAVKSIGIFGTPALIITPGGAKELLVAGDTVNLSPSTPILLDT
ncbi:MAG: MlaD family protein, partial [Bacteroidota bacterium]